jgi:hypothetical protein
MRIVDTLLITSQYLRENSIISDAVDDKILDPIILIAQDKYIHPLLGGVLYNKILDDIKNSTLTPTYKSLVDLYILPALLQYCVYESVPYITFKFKNKGIQKQTSDTSETPDLSELYFLRDNILISAKFLGERMAAFLCANTNLYPEYNSFQNGELNSKKQDIPSSIFFPKKFVNRKGYGFDTPLY